MSGEFRCRRGDARACPDGLPASGPDGLPGPGLRWHAPPVRGRPRAKRRALSWLVLLGLRRERQMRMQMVSRMLPCSLMEGHAKVRMLGRWCGRGSTVRRSWRLWGSSPPGRPRLNSLTSETTSCVSAWRVNSAKVCMTCCRAPSLTTSYSFLGTWFQAHLTGCSSNTQGYTR